MTRAKIAPKTRASKAFAFKEKNAKKPIAKKVALPKKVISKAKPGAKKANSHVVIKERLRGKDLATGEATKKQVRPKRNAITREGAKTLDLCLILDCTGSMSSWIQRSKNTLREIIDHVKNENKNLTVRVAFVAYRDISDANRFDVTDFTEDIDLVKKKIESQ